MINTPNSQASLVDLDDSVLLVIDIQDYFLKKYDEAKSQALVGHVVWLLHVARHLDVPVVAMAEDIAGTGRLHEAVEGALPPGTQVHDKDFFDISSNRHILSEVEATGRKTMVCVGVETDVCVAQSAIGLIGRGYKVLALHDAVASTASDETVGLGRMRDAGVAISSVKALYYEWMRSVSRTRALRTRAPDLEQIRPATLVL